MSELKNYVVPLAHDTLTRDEVAARCIAAAVAKGYKKDPDPEWSDLSRFQEECPLPAREFVTFNEVGVGFGFRASQTPKGHTLTTLEAFEEYCGVKPVNEGDKGLEERITDLENAVGRIDVFVNQLADILAEKLQEPKEGAKTNNRVAVGGLFFDDGDDTYLMCPDGSKLFIDGTAAAPTWGKQVLTLTASPHTLVIVEKHTVGKFYLLKEGDPNDFNQYALCLSAVNFVAAQDVAGVITISKIHRDFIALQEVQPLNQ